MEPSDKMAFDEQLRLFESNASKLNNASNR
jgi:hypothetical protein